MAINIWKSYMCTLVEEMNIEAILAAMNTTELMVEIQAWIFFSSVHSCEDCFYIHVFNISAHIWFSYIYSHYSPLQRFIWIQHNDQLPVGLLAQLVEHCTSITEVMGSNSIWAWIFSGLILTTSSVVFIAQGSLLYSNVELFCQRRLILSFRFPFRHTNTRRNIN